VEELLKVVQAQSRNQNLAKLGMGSSVQDVMKLDCTETTQEQRNNALSTKKFKD